MVECAAGGRVVRVRFSAPRLKESFLWSLKRKNRVIVGLMKKLELFTTNAFFVWIASSISFFVLFLIATKGFSEELDEKILFGNSDFTYTLLGLLIFIGGISFIIFLVGTVKFFFKREKTKHQNKFIILLLLFFAILTLPIQLFIEVVSPISRLKDFKKKGVQKSKLPDLGKDLGFGFMIIVFVLPIWMAGYLFTVYIPARTLGFVEDPIPVAGTGSMYPTFPKGESENPVSQGKEIIGTYGMLPYPNGISLFGKRLMGHEIGRGDIVVVENDKIRKLTKELYGDPSGWIKRVIAIPGDKLELKEGIVYLNKKPLKENYTAKPLSTFGQTFLIDCREIKVPNNSLFVMGDNRKGSGDSREIGFISIKDVEYVLPLEKQKGKLDRNWRDTSKDFDESSKIRLDKNQYLKLLNERREKARLKPLKYEPKLEISALKRGEVVLKFNDFSFEATRSGYTQVKAMNEAGYSNIVWNEGIVQGHYEADELIEYLNEFVDWKKNLLEVKDFQEIGIGEIEQAVNGCPTNIIVLHFAGYLPPSYTKAEIEGWKQTLTQLKEIQGGWSGLKNYKSIYDNYKNDVDRINEIIAIRINNISAIVAKMETNQWLTKGQIDYTYEDVSLFNEQQSLSEKLNSK